MPLTVGALAGRGGACQLAAAAHRSTCASPAKLKRPITLHPPPPPPKHACLRWLLTWPLPTPPFHLPPAAPVHRHLPRAQAPRLPGLLAHLQPLWRDARGPGHHPRVWPPALLLRHQHGERSGEGVRGRLPFVRRSPPRLPWQLLLGLRTPRANAHPNPNPNPPAPLPPGQHRQLQPRLVAHPAAQPLAVHAPGDHRRLRRLLHRADRRRHRARQRRPGRLCTHQVRACLVPSLLLLVAGACLRARVRCCHCDYVLLSNNIDAATTPRRPAPPVRST